MQRMFFSVAALVIALLLIVSCTQTQTGAQFAGTGSAPTDGIDRRIDAANQLLAILNAVSIIAKAEVGLASVSAADRAAVVAAWKLSPAWEKARPGAVLALTKRYSADDLNAALAATLARRATQFLTDYGVAPELRVTAHAGDVAIGEIGESRKQIALLGDVVNVAARIQELGKTLDARFIASAELLGRAGPAWGGRARPLGPQLLRGRAQEIEIFSIAAEIGT